MREVNQGVCYACALLWSVLVMGTAFYAVAFLNWSAWWMLGAYILVCQADCDIDPTYYIEDEDEGLPTEGAQPNDQ